MTAMPWRPQVAGDVPDRSDAPRLAVSRPLYECTDALLDVRAELLDSEDGELTPEMEARLDRAVGDFGQKVEQVAFMIREMEALERMANDEAERIAKRARVRGALKSRLKAYLQRQMETADVPRVERPLVTVRLQASPPSVKHVLTPEILAGHVYAPFVRVIPETYQLDSKSVISAWKAGEPLPDGVTVEQSRHLRIA